MPKYRTFPTNACSGLIDYQAATECEHRATITLGEDLVIHVNDLTESSRTYTVAHAADLDGNPLEALTCAKVGELTTAEHLTFAREIAERFWPEHVIPSDGSVRLHAPSRPDSFIEG